VGPHTPFNGVTYCEFAPNITAQQKWNVSGASGEVTVRQGSTCLVATKGGGPVSMAPCDGSIAQAWLADSVDITIAHVKPAADVSLCLTTNSSILETVACVAKPKNCTSLWDHCEYS
jgi:hypothetical protein